MCLLLSITRTAFFLVLGEERVLSVALFHFKRYQSLNLLSFFTPIRTRPSHFLFSKKVSYFYLFTDLVSLATYVLPA